MIGLVSSIRFGFAPLGIPNTGLGSSENKTQGGLPPGGIRFGFRPRGVPIGSTGTGSGVPYYQSGLPPNALRFGFKPIGNAGAVTPVTAPGHRAQYSGIQLPKKRRKKKQQPAPQLTPEIISASVAATEEWRDGAAVHVAVRIAGAAATWEHVRDHAYAALGVRMSAALDLTETTPDRCLVFCTVVTDEEQALAVLRSTYESLKQFFGE